MELLVVTGLSGAGKSEAVKVLEDIGYYCVDNMPPALIPDFSKVVGLDGEIKKAAVVTDVRVGHSFLNVGDVVSDLKENGVNCKILFLDCSDEEIIRRYALTRRKHPLCDGNNSIGDAIIEERRRVASVRENADYIIDTSLMDAKQLRSEMYSLFSVDAFAKLSVRCVSFGFKHGPVAESDLLFDVRSLPNPYYVDELRSFSGLDEAIKDYVLNNDVAAEFRDRLLAFLDFAMPLYIKEGKSQLVISFGCSGGRHRSVVFAELVNEHLCELGYSSVAVHRDIDK